MERCHGAAQFATNSHAGAILVAPQAEGWIVHCASPVYTRFIGQRHLFFLHLKSCKLGLILLISEWYEYWLMIRCSLGVIIQKAVRTSTLLISLTVYYS